MASPTDLLELLETLERQLSDERRTLHAIVDRLLLDGDPGGALDALIDDERDLSDRRAILHRAIDAIRRETLAA